MKKILVLEDNPTMLVHLSNIIQETDFEKEIYCFDNTKDAYSCALEMGIDLFVIDIILNTSKAGDSSGLDFVENIRRISHYEFVPIIFVTSLEDVKLYTYEKLHCYSFLEKPFDANRLKLLIEQCLRFPGNINTTKTLYFRKDGIILAVERENITHAECNNHILNIHTNTGDDLNIPYITIKQFLIDVDSDEFVQCSRNTVINKKYICAIDIPNRIILLKNDLGRVDIGITYKNHIREIIR